MLGAIKKAWVLVKESVVRLINDNALTRGAAIAFYALSDFLNTSLPVGEIILSVANAGISFALISVMFGAICNFLPDRTLQWRDARLRAVVTAAPSPSTTEEMPFRLIERGST